MISYSVSKSVVYIELPYFGHAKHLITNEINNRLCLKFVEWQIELKEKYGSYHWNLYKKKLY